MKFLHRLVVLFMVGLVFLLVISGVNHSDSASRYAVPAPVVPCSNPHRGDDSWVGEPGIWEKAKKTGRGSDIREALYLELERQEWKPVIFGCDSEFTEAARALLKMFRDGGKAMQISGDAFLQAMDSARSELVLASRPAEENSLSRWISAASVLYYTNPSQMSREQYIQVTKSLHRCKDCNILMWGVGFDARLWSRMVSNHTRMVFLEGTPGWFKLVKREIVGIEVYLVKYKHKMVEADELLEGPLTDEKLMVDLPDTVLNTNWNIIIVDAPQGYGGANHPGRMESIYTTLKLKDKALQAGLQSVEVMVHDASRHVEITWSDAIFGKDGYKSVEGHRANAGRTALRHYVFKA